jgi:hypothetical protein
MEFTNGHALLIGVGKYQHNTYTPYAETAADARELAAVLRDPERCGYPDAQVTPLLDEQATRSAILNAFDTLAQLGEDATLFLFYSGHGAMGTDGNFYLTTHDTQVEGARVAAGSALSEQELLERLLAIKAKRMLLVVDAHHSSVGETSPDVRAQPIASVQLPEKTAAALLATGEGRAIITACRENQYSFVGEGELTLFGQALVDGLEGKGDYASNGNGFINVFDLYSQLYDTLRIWVPQRVAASIRQRYGDAQEPELTVLKGVRPFAIACYRGPATLGGFSAPDKPAIDAGLREVDQARSRRLLGQLLASGPFAGVTINTQQSGGINLGIGNQIGQIGDIVAGDKIGGDKVGGDKISVGDISGSSGQIAVGRGITQNSGETSPSVTQSRRFEAAMPRVCYVGRPTKILAMVVLPDSEGLAAFLPIKTKEGDVIRKRDVKPLDVAFAVPYVYLSLSAPDFTIVNPKVTLFVPPDKDSGRAIFTLTPTVPRERPLVFINLYQDAQFTILIDSLELSTEILPQIDKSVDMEPEREPQPQRLAPAIIIEEYNHISKDVSITNTGGQVAYGEDIGQNSSAAPQAAVFRPNTSRLISIMNSTLQPRDMDTLALVMGDYGFTFDPATLPAELPQQVNALIKLCRTNKAVSALVHSLIDRDAIDSEQAAWQEWAEDLDKSAS